MSGSETEQEKFDDLLFLQGGCCATCGAKHKSMDGQKKILLTMNRFYSSTKLYCQSCAFSLLKENQNQPHYGRNTLPDKKAAMLKTFGLEQVDLF